MGSQRKYFWWEVTTVFIRTLQVSKSVAEMQQMAVHFLPIKHVDSSFPGLSIARTSSSKHLLTRIKIYITTLIGSTESLSCILNVCLKNKGSCGLLPVRM